jgi:hypothetical protein
VKRLEIHVQEQLGRWVCHLFDFTTKADRRLREGAKGARRERSSLLLVMMRWSMLTTGSDSRVGQLLVVLPSSEPSREGLFVLRAEVTFSSLLSSAPSQHTAQHALSTSLLPPFARLPASPLLPHLPSSTSSNLTLSPLQRPAATTKPSDAPQPTDKVGMGPRDLLAACVRWCAVGGRGSAL